MTAQAPDELTIWLDLVHFPVSATPLGAVDSTFLGAEESARELLSPFDAIAGAIGDTRVAMSPADLATITADPIDPSPGISSTLPIRVLDDGVIDALVRDPIFPLLTVQVRQLGGAISNENQLPNGPLSSEHLIYLFGSPSAERTADRIKERIAAFMDDLTPFTGHGKPLTFLAPGEEMADALPEKSVRELATIKQKCDPNRTLRS